MMLKKSDLTKNDYLNNVILLPSFSWASCLLIAFHALIVHKQVRCCGVFTCTICTEYDPARSLV